MRMLTAADIERAVRPALEEDVGSGDVTTAATIPSGTRATARLVAREPLVVAGLPVAEAVFLAVSSEVAVERRVRDGDAVGPGDVLMRLAGPAAALLTGERVALNFVQRLSGIATLTRRFVEAVAGTRAEILDTRKTTPGLRRLEKYAVACGGGRNHRSGLHDAILIKDNHLAALRGAAPDPVTAAVRRARERAPGLTIEIEADTLDQVRTACAAGAEIILLDNMTTEDLASAVALVAGRARTEASGGVTLSTVRAVADTGVDFISVGALTHSARAMDLALDFEMG